MAVLLKCRFLDSLYHLISSDFLRRYWDFFKNVLPDFIQKVEKDYQRIPSKALINNGTVKTRRRIRFRFFDRILRCKNKHEENWGNEHREIFYLRAQKRQAGTDPECCGWTTALVTVLTCAFDPMFVRLMIPATTCGRVLLLRHPVAQWLLISFLPETPRSMSSSPGIMGASFTEKLEIHRLATQTLPQNPGVSR